MDLDRRVLHTAPWCWPRAGSRSRELLVERLGPVPPLGIGVAPGISVRGQTISLWHLQSASTARPVPPGFAHVPFGREAQASWHAAALALPRSLPVLWRSVHDAARDLPVATFLRSHLEAAGFEERDRVLDGPSFGLTFFLLLASVVLEEPMPEDTAASAALDERGRLHPVDALDRKIAGLVAMAPSIRRIVVAAAQHDEARAAAGDHVEVIGAASAAEALERVYGPRLADHLITRGTDPERRAELVDSFFRLALVGRGAAVDWSPVERGAALALEAWELDEDQRYRLAFARAVAARHERNAGELPLPGDPHAEAWLARQPAPLRLALLTHLVQQSADSGTPPPAETEALARRALPGDIHEALVPHLKLRGALARLQAVTGREAEALAAQRQLAEALAAVFAEHEVSFPLAEWFRLAGVLGDGDAFDAACEFARRVATSGNLQPAGKPYVALAEGRSRVLLSRADASTVSALQALSGDLGIPAHVRWSARRWLAAAVRRVQGEEAGRRALHALLADARTQAESSTPAARYAVLAELDAAIHAADLHRAQTLCARLHELDPGPVGHLLRVSPDPVRIARLYPY